MVPEAIRKKHTITVAAGADYPPAVFMRGNDIVGWNPDLAKALGNLLNLQFTFINVPFAEIVTGLQSGKYEVAMSSVNVTAQREKVMNFVSYFNSGSGLAVPAANPHRISKLSDLCGLKVALLVGGVQASDLQQSSTDCRGNGHAAIQVLPFPNQAAVDLALKSGRADAQAADGEALAYVALKDKGIKYVGQYSNALAGIALSKATTTRFAVALQAALNKLIADGTYASILKRWNVQSGAIAHAAVNPPTSN